MRARWWWPWGVRVHGEATERARDEAEQRLEAVQRQWPEVNRAHDRLSEWVEQALGGRT